MGPYIPQFLQALVPLLWISSTLLLISACVGLVLGVEPESFRFTGFR